MRVVSSKGVGLMSWMVPKERYWPLGGGSGGIRFRSSGGREVSSGIAVGSGRVPAEDWLYGSDCCSSCSRFWGVKDL